MNRTVTNFVIDLLAFLAMCATIATGLLIKYMLPPRSGGMGRGGGLTLWNWNRHDWGDLHFYLAIGLLSLLLVHVTLHWHWVVATAGRLASSRAATARAMPTPARHIAVASFLMLIFLCFAGFFWAASRDVERRDGAGAFAARGLAGRADVDQTSEGTQQGDAHGRGFGGGWRGGRFRSSEQAR